VTQSHWTASFPPLFTELTSYDSKETD